MWHLRENPNPPACGKLSGFPSLARTHLCGLAMPVPGTRAPRASQLCALPQGPGALGHHRARALPFGWERHSVSLSTAG